MREQFNAVVSRLEASRDEKNDATTYSIVVSDESDTLAHFFSDDQPVNLRSIAKPIVCLALGIAIDEGLKIDEVDVTLETSVWSLLEPFAPSLSEDAIHHWSSVKLIDLLRITFGQTEGIVFTKDLVGRDPSTFLSYVLEYPAIGRVGVDFTYSNAGTFLVSAIITERLGVNLDDFVQKHLLSKLNVEKPRWDFYGRYVAGCTGLWLRNSDLHRIGILLRDDGRYGGQQIAPPWFVQLMRKPQVEPPTHRYVSSRAFPKWSYGLNLWICEDGTYYCDGTDGQYLIVIPGNNRVVTVLAHEPDSVVISDALKLLKQ